MPPRVTSPRSTSQLLTVPPRRSWPCRLADTFASRRRTPILVPVHPQIFWGCRVSVGAQTIRNGLGTGPLYPIATRRASRPAREEHASAGHSSRSRESVNPADVNAGDHSRQRERATVDASMNCTARAHRGRRSHIHADCQFDRVRMVHRPTAPTGTSPLTHAAIFLAWSPSNEGGEALSDDARRTPRGVSFTRWLPRQPYKPSFGGHLDPAFRMPGLPRLPVADAERTVHRKLNGAPPPRTSTPRRSAVPHQGAVEEMCFELAGWI